MSRCLFALLLVFPLFLFAKEEYPTPTQSPLRMKLPEGFRVRLVAGEPTLIKPIAAATDERGRLWVIESQMYPHWLKTDGTGKDRILILEPKADGTFTAKVFLDNGINLSGIAVGFGGVWLASVPKIIHIPVKDDKPAGAAVVHVDGFSLNTKHNVVNGLAWGPDGWLYGLNGIESQSRIGAPGTPQNKRVGIHCGVWRYHPTRRKVEAFAHGTTNPWGIDWDDYGEMFITNCVIKHAFHVVQGAHFVRMYGQDLNANTYALLESCADHIHWGGGSWTTSRGGKGDHDAAGGGHAHAGAMVYLGDNWPREYRNRLFMGNIHGSRLNQDRLERSRSGYVLKHGEDFLFANDPWFRPLWMHAAHDGGMYVGDWHDTGECHNYDKTHPSGRIYHVSYGSPKRPAVDLGKASDAELVKLQTSANEWMVRQARRLLQERAAAGTLAKEVPALLTKAMAEQAVPGKLRLLWALNAIGALPENKLRDHLASPEPELRTWAIRLLSNQGSITPETHQRFAELAGKETAEPVLLALASALQSLPPEQRWGLAEPLVGQTKSASDPYLPLMIWYGIEGIVGQDDGRAVKLLAKTTIPLVRQYVSRRLVAQEGERQLALLTALLRVDKLTEAFQRDVLRGMSEALAGRRSVKLPAGWPEVYCSLSTSSDAEVRERVTVLSVLFGDKQALTELTRTIADAKAARESRTRALDMLLDKRAAGVPGMLRTLLDDGAMRSAALRGLAQYDDPKTPSLILDRYAKLTDAEKADAVSTLASRPPYALALLDAVEKKVVARADVTPFTARQLAALKNKQVSERLEAVWGTIRPAAKDKQKLLSQYKKLATPEQLKAADRSSGRAVWAKTCASCHVLFNEGGKIGPELTGAQRTKPEYILEKVLDPNAVVPRDYQVARIVTTRGRVIMGVVKQENDKVLLLQTATEEVRVLKSEVEERDTTKTSLMPEGQLAVLSDSEVRDLLAYLASPDQVPLPGAK